MTHPPLLIGPLNCWLGQVMHFAVSLKGAPLSHKEAQLDQPVLILDGSAYSAAIPFLDKLQDLYADPDLFPNNNRGMPLALIPWSRAAGKGNKIKRKAAAGLIMRQLEDGRPYLQGKQSGLADILARAALMKDVPDTLSDWAARMDAGLTAINSAQSLPNAINPSPRCDPAHGKLETILVDGAVLPVVVDQS